MQRIYKHITRVIYPDDGNNGPSMIVNSYGVSSAECLEEGGGG